MATFNKSWEKLPENDYIDIIGYCGGEGGWFVRIVLVGETSYSLYEYYEGGSENIVGAFHDNFESAYKAGNELT